MAIMFNGKKVTKIMLGDKEIMSAGVDLNEWIGQIKTDMVLNARNGQEQVTGNSLIFPEIEIPNGSTRLSFDNSKMNPTETVCVFYDKNRNYLSGKQINFNTGLLNISIPSNAKYFKYSGAKPRVTKFS